MTPEQIAHVCRDVSAGRIIAITDSLNKAIETYGIPKGAWAEFIANIAHESGEFTIKAENLNYTTAARLCAVWPSRFTVTGEQKKKNAADFIKNPKKLANEVYNGRMGNKTGTDDGYVFRGGGYAQITGREAYESYAAYVNKRDNTSRTAEEIAALVQTDDDWAMDSAAWFFCEFKDLVQLALDNKFKDLVKKWNGGYIGLEERKLYYTRAGAIIV